jgi:hypothetical protein
MKAESQPNKLWVPCGKSEAIANESAKKSERAMIRESAIQREQRGLRRNQPLVATEKNDAVQESSQWRAAS